MWGAWLIDIGFTAEAAERMRGDEAGGWTPSYRRETASGASWLGRCNGRILYTRALCDGECEDF